MQVRVCQCYNGDNNEDAIMSRYVESSDHIRKGFIQSADFEIASKFL